MNVVMELNSRKEPSNSQRIPLRYVLLIDVSASMKKQIGKQNITLLQRVQVSNHFYVLSVIEIARASPTSLTELKEAAISESFKLCHLVSASIVSPCSDVRGVSGA